MGRILHFRQRETWQEAHKLVLEETRFLCKQRDKNLVSHLLNGLIASTERRQ